MGIFSLSFFYCFFFFLLLLYKLDGLSLEIIERKMSLYVWDAINFYHFSGFFLICFIPLVEKECK